MEVGEEAVRALGAGFDLTSDFRLRFAKDGAGRRLVELGGETRDVPLPGGAGGATLRGVPLDVGVDKGDRIRFRSDVLEFNQVRTSHALLYRLPPARCPGGRRRRRRGHPLFAVDEGDAVLTGAAIGFMRLVPRSWPVASAKTATLGRGRIGQLGQIVPCPPSRGRGSALSDRARFLFFVSLLQKLPVLLCSPPTLPFPFSCKRN